MIGRSENGNGNDGGKGACGGKMGAGGGHDGRSGGGYAGGEEEIEFEGGQIFYQTAVRPELVSVEMISEINKLKEQDEK